MIELNARQWKQLEEAGEIVQEDGSVIRMLALPIDKAEAKEINHCILREIMNDIELRNFDYKFRYKFFRHTAQFVFRGNRNVVDRYIYMATSVSVGE